MLTVFAIFLLLVSAAFFILRQTFPIPFFARHSWRWGGGFLIAFLALQLYFWLRPAPVPLTQNEKEALRHAIALALDSIEKDGLVRLPATAAVVHFASDPTDAATSLLRGELASRGGWTAVKGSPAAAFLKSVGKSLYEATSVDEYLRPGARVGIEVVFHGSLRHVGTDAGVSRAKIFLSAYDTRIGETVRSGEFSGEYPRVRTAAGRAVVAKSRMSRIWIFAIAALILPWLAAPLSLKALARRSNGASALVLGGLVLLDALIGAFLFYGVASRVWTSIAVLALCAFYDLVCCEIINRRNA